MCFDLFVSFVLTISSPGQMGGYYNPYTSGFSAAHMAAAAAAAAAQQSGQVSSSHQLLNPARLLTPPPLSLTAVAQSFPTTKMCRRHCKVGRVMPGLNKVGRGGWLGGGKG